jgi:hypothetical protein
MKRSARVRLVLLGSAVGLHGCGTDQEVYRQRYDSLEECRRDWGDTAYCGHDAGGASGSWSSSGGSGGGAAGGNYYYGPRYYWDPHTGRATELKPDGSTRPIGDAHWSGQTEHFGGVRMGAGFVSRGGFGSSARAFGGGRA